MLTIDNPHNTTLAPEQPEQAKEDLQALKLNGQVAIVTGGGRGIGRAIAQRLAEAGATVVILARTLAELDETITLITQAGGQAHRYAVDITDAHTLQSIVQTVEQQLGPVDLLVNNAAINTPFGALWEVDAEAWWRCMEINVRGPLLCSKAVLPSMMTRGRGRIINVGSAVFLRAFLRYSAYSTSKTTLVRLTEHLAAELRPYGIQAFTIDPGPVPNTGMTGPASNFPAGIKPISPHYAAELVLTLAAGKADLLSGAYITVYDDLERMVASVASVEQDHLYSLLMFGASNGDYFLPRGRL